MSLVASLGTLKPKLNPTPNLTLIANEPILTAFFSFCYRQFSTIRHSRHPSLWIFGNHLKAFHVKIIRLFVTFYRQWRGDGLSNIVCTPLTRSRDSPKKNEIFDPILGEISTDYSYPQKRSLNKCLEAFN